MAKRVGAMMDDRDHDEFLDDLVALLICLVAVLTAWAVLGVQDAEAERKAAAESVAINMEVAR